MFTVSCLENYLVCSDFELSAVSPIILLQQFVYHLEDLLHHSILTKIILTLNIEKTRKHSHCRLNETTTENNKAMLIVLLLCKHPVNNMSSMHMRCAYI